MASSNLHVRPIGQLKPLVRGKGVASQAEQEPLNTEAEKSTMLEPVPGDD
jgi:hypothetical protein